MSCTKNKRTHAVVDGCFVLAFLPLVSSWGRRGEGKSDELCCEGQVHDDISSLVLPLLHPLPHMQSHIVCCTFINMTELLLPAGKSAERGAEKESWRTCMKMKRLQRVLIKLAHVDLKRRLFAEKYVLWLSSCLFFSKLLLLLHFFSDWRRLWWLCDLLKVKKYRFAVY